MTELEVGNCGDCPFVQRTQNKLQNIALLKDRVTRYAVDESLDTVLAPAVMELLGESMLADIEPAFVSEQEVAAELRKGAATALERLDTQEEAILFAANAHIKACEGPLKMRAAKAGTIITNTVCNSPRLPAGESLERVVVKRERKR